MRDDYLDWQKTAREIIAAPERVDFAVMMVGSNDRQSLKDAAGSYDVRSDRWKEIYGQRVEDFASIFRQKGIPLVWVGLPVMRAERMSADAIYMNDIYRDRASKAGATYVDSWDAFVDEQGQFNAYGPDVSGQVAKLRAGDGVHFTKAGALKLAHFVEGDIRRIAIKAPPPIELADTPQAPATPQPEALASVNLSDPDAIVDANAVIRSQIRREAAAGAASPDLQASLPLPELPQALRLPLRPVAGPIVALTTPSLAPGGVLATRTASLGGGNPEALALIERALVDGRPQDAKPGRADDFSWPRR